MRFLAVVMLSFGLLGPAASAVSAPDRGVEDSLRAMRLEEQRIADISYRLAAANLALCPRRQFLPGFSVHYLDQYAGALRPAAIGLFHLDRGMAVLTVTAGSAAARAGLARDDLVLALDGAPLAVPAHHPEQDGPVFDAIEAAFADGAADLIVDRGGRRLTVHIDATLGCASRFQMAGNGGRNANADGRYVTITPGLAVYAADDAELAVVLAHEFAHNILGHRARLDQGHVARGFFGNFGRNAQGIRDTEVEADRFSIYLLDRAGYDPAAAIRFWTRFGPSGLGFLGSPTHPNWRARIATMETEIAAVRAARAAGHVPVPPLTAPAT